METTLEQRREWLAAQHPRWQPRTLAQQLTASAERFGDRPYLLTAEGSFTYRQLRTWSRALAKGLLAGGVRRGEHVAMVMANYPEFAALKYAIAAAGAVAVPVNYRLRTNELDYVLRQSDSVVLITMDRFRDLDYPAMLDETCPGWRAGSFSAYPELRRVVTMSGLDALIDEGAGVSDEELDELEAAGQADDIADIVYTSGTTGHPKGALLTHDGLLRCSCASAFIRGMQDGRRVLFSLPLYHVFGYVEGLLAVTWVGGAIVPQVDFDPVATLEAIERFGVHEGLFVPTMTVALVEHPRRNEFDLHTLSTVMSAAAPAPVRLWQQVRGEMGVAEVTTAYGQTEASASTTYTMPDGPLELVAATVGRPKPGYVAGDPAIGGLVADYKVVDPVTGEDLPEGAEGELAVRGPQIMRGYYNLPEETAAALNGEGWLRSGDLGRIRPDGYLVLTGRSKELYKRGGELVAPKEIEDVLTSHPDVSQAYVVGLPDDRWGEIGCAFVIAVPGAAPDATALLALCRDKLARFKVPDQIRFITADELPTTATGKVQKFRLVQRAIDEPWPPTTTGAAHHDH